MIERGVVFTAVVGVVFLLLKLVGAIDWSWWLVTIPFWLPFAIGLFFLIFGAALGFLDQYAGRRRL